MNTSDGVGILLVVTVCVILILVAIVFLEKSLLKASVAKRIEIFRARLKEETERALREYEGSIHQQNIVLSQLVTRKGEVFHQLFNQIGDVVKQGRNYDRTIHVKDLYFRNRHIDDAFDHFRGFYEENAIMCTDKLAADVEELFSDFEEEIAYLKANTGSSKGDKEKEGVKLEKSKQNWKELESAMQKLMGTVRREYNYLHSNGEKSSASWHH